MVNANETCACFVPYTARTIRPFSFSFSAFCRTLERGGLKGETDPTGSAPGHMPGSIALLRLPSSVQQAAFNVPRTANSDVMVAGVLYDVMDTAYQGLT